MAASADRLDEFLAAARVQGRPAVAISPGMAAELLGFAPDAAYWSTRRLEGWVADAGAVITFTPVVDDHEPETTDVRLVLTWLGPHDVVPGPGLVRRRDGEGVRVSESQDVTTANGEVTVATTIRVGDRTASLAEPRLRRLALLMAEVERDL